MEACARLAKARGVAKSTLRREDLVSIPAEPGEGGRGIRDRPAVELQRSTVVGELDPLFLARRLQLADELDALGHAASLSMRRARSGTRTHSRGFTRAVLYQLSYP